MRYAMFLILSLLATSVHAGGSSQAPVYAEAARQSGSIITPDVATGMKKFYRWANDINGDTVVCPNSDWYQRGGLCLDETGANRWSLLKHAVPKGKTYAGFQYVAYGDNIIVYWK